ncbi:hypothetical protein CIPAW_10G131300 [Carya illinoinensis]|uniref:Uncharacterized protein n=1 Tax=Carya illinoinensis TaxID=32201 RepID=A0A8T1PCH4_CARIL|nr:hypothetical protein CIPAW_10G131300 [Carya illinoinensis]
MYVQKELNCINIKLNIIVTRIINPYEDSNILAKFIYKRNSSTNCRTFNVKEIARVEWIREGSIPLQTIRAKIVYYSYTGGTIYGGY